MVQSQFLLSVEIPWENYFSDWIPAPKPERIVIDYDAQDGLRKSLNFDRALPQYRTQNGVLPNRDPLVKHSPPLMWAEALDLLSPG